MGRNRVYSARNDSMVSVSKVGPYSKTVEPRKGRETTSGKESTTRVLDH